MTSQQKKFLKVTNLNLKFGVSKIGYFIKKNEKRARQSEDYLIE